MRTLVLAGNDLRRFFVQPTPWVLLAALLALLAYFFLLSLDAYLRLMPKLAGLPDAPGVTDLVVLPSLRALASLLLIVVPLTGMRAIAGERQAGTLPLLIASGVGDVGLVLGKFLSLAVFFGVTVALALAIPLSLEWGTSLDLGRLGAAGLGLVLFAGALAAIALAVSSFAAQPLAAAGMALILDLALWMADAGARYEGVSSSFLNYLALPTHLEPFLHGVVASVDVVYFVLLAAVALALAARRVGALRGSG
ncbi:MAG TPA: ABC transporter permease [Rudaea sp.]|nr:ABC transporter permease [Rudaea sp.]